MSKNISIQEGGIGKQLTVDKLKTNLAGGGTCLWIPEDDTRLGTKYISENGTYRASSDGLYGYSEVTVSGVGTASGKDPDGSGDDATATPDPRTGKIVITKQPSRIEVITPPTNPYGIYTNGQTITKDGMVVKAYYESGGEWGTVPIGEITINPTVAVYDKSTDRYDRYAVSDLPTNWEQPLHLYGFITLYSQNSRTGEIEEAFYATGDTILVKNISGSAEFFVASASDGVIGHATYGTQSMDYVANRSYTHNGQTVHYIHVNLINWPGIIKAEPEIGVYQTSDPDSNTLWTSIYGDISGDSQRGSHQTITVSWPRPGDGKVLETTFEILVAPGYTPNSEE